MFGAAIGALPAFAFTGVSVLVGVALALAGAEYDSSDRGRSARSSGPTSHSPAAWRPPRTPLASGNILLGILAGIVAALVGEGLSRLFLVHGDTHIDPPASAIAIMSVFDLIPLALAG